MPLPIPQIQAALRDDQIDGWLLYDFHGSNPIAVSLTGLAGRHTTRRWYYFVPASGTPVKLVHAIEPRVLADQPGDTRTYAGRRQLESEVARVLDGRRVVAMEYSPGCAIPYVSRVDAGTIEFIRGLGVTVVSSGDLVGRFEAAWNDAAIATHRSASDKLYRVKDRAFAFVATQLAADRTVSEWDVQQEMLRWFDDEGLVTDSPPIVAAGPHAGDPHYGPTETTSAIITRNQVVLLDLWGKLSGAGAVYADITWTGIYGAPSDHVREVFETVAAGRDAALATVQAAVADGRPLHGWEVDRAARDVIAQAGYGERFIHRTGHSLGEEVHGNGVHMDDYETHDDRRLLVGTGFTIEPGVYLAEFGIRSEINVVVGPALAEPTGPVQTSIVRLDRLVR